MLALIFFKDYLKKDIVKSLILGDYVTSTKNTI
jgi:hypothetical protein